MFNIAVQHQGPCLLVTTSGHAELPELCALADFPAAVGRHRTCTRAMFDLLALQPKLSAEEHAGLGKHLAATLGGFERVAVVLADEADMLAATIAASQGLPLRTFSTLQDAHDWLLRP
jgi:hypothetical protein